MKTILGTLTIAVTIVILTGVAIAIDAPVYKEGDSWVFRVKGSGEFDGENQITFKNGQFESSNAAFLGTALLVAVNLNDPEKKALEFPLVPGKKWSYRYSHMNRGGKMERRDATVEVIGTPQPIETPVGKFNAIEIRRTDKGRAQFSITYFYTSDTKSVVKLVADIYIPGAAQTRTEMELIKYSVQ